MCKVPWRDIMSDDSFKDMLMRLKNRSSFDPDKTDIMDTREIIGEDLAQQEAEKIFGKTEAKADFQDRIKRERAARGMDILEKAKEKSKKVRWLPDTSDDVTKEVKRSALKKMGSKAGRGLLRRAAGLAIGGPMMLASEMADAAELGPKKDSRDAIVEAPIDAEMKQMLLRKHDVREKVNSPDYFRELVQDEGKVEDMVDSLDKRSDEQKEKDAEDMLRRKQILSGYKLK